MAARGNIRRSTVYAKLSEEHWSAYKAMLLNPERYTLAAVLQWLAERGVKSHAPIVHRDRHYELAKAEQYRAARDYAEQMLRIGQSEGWDISKLNTEIAGQKLFDALNSMPGLTCESAAQAIRLLETTAMLRSSESKARLVDLQAQQLRSKFDQAATAARTKSPDGKLSEQDISEIREAVFGRVG